MGTALSIFRVLPRQGNPPAEDSFRGSAPPAAPLTTCDGGCDRASGAAQGRWRTIGPRPGDAESAQHNEWCVTGGCLHAAFDSGSGDGGLGAGGGASWAENRALLGGATLLLIGNSHMRNLFRCAVDVLSDGRSRAVACPGPSCLSCLR